MDTEAHWELHPVLPILFKTRTEFHMCIWLRFPVAGVFVPFSTKLKSLLVPVVFLLSKYLCAVIVQLSGSLLISWRAWFLSGFLHSILFQFLNHLCLISSISWGYQNVSLCVVCQRSVTGPTEWVSVSCGVRVHLVVGC